MDFLQRISFLIRVTIVLLVPQPEHSSCFQDKTRQSCLISSMDLGPPRKRGTLLLSVVALLMVFIKRRCALQMLQSYCYCKVASIVSNSVRPHRRQPTRLPHPWDSPGKNTGVGCHVLLQCMKRKSESEVTQSCPTLSNPMDCSLPDSSAHGIFQARVLKWVALPSPEMLH